MKLEVLGSIGALVLAVVGSSPASGYSLPRTLPKEDNVILACTVSAQLMAVDCALPPANLSGASAASQRIQRLIHAEASNPDYLTGAAPGARVLVMIRRSTAVGLDGANPGQALAPPSPSLAPLVAPVWRVMPSARDLAGYYPDRALRNDITGTAAAHCTVGPGGDLLGCWVTAETPADMEFGIIALILTTSVQMKPAANDGSPTVGRPYVLQTTFNIDMHSRSFGIALSSGE